MKKALVMPVLAALLFAAACGGEATTPGVPPTTGPPASVRFFNATTGMTGSGGFTTNGQFAAGSALAFGQSTQTCSAVNPGSTSFGFGAASPGGTGLSGNALATLSAQTVTARGNFTVAATGSATTSPKLFMLDNNFSGSLGTNQAAVRFVNLAPGSGTTANTFNGYLGTYGGIHAQLIATNIPVGSSTEFTIVPSGPHVFSILQGQNVVILGSTATLQAGTVNTIAIVPNTSGGFQLISIPRCS